MGEGGNDAKAGSCYAAGDSSATPPFNKSKLIVSLNDLAKQWDIIDE